MKLVLSPCTSSGVISAKCTSLSGFQIVVQSHDFNKVPYIANISSKKILEDGQFFVIRI